MSKKFDYFIIFAEMRTGSNFLESNVNEFPDLHCYGEAFNPFFLVDPARRLVDPKRNELFGMTQAMRDGDPLRLIERMKEGTDGTPGFRFFHDHDPRVFEAAIDDPRCAKVVLTRNLVESYVSRKIAWETDQWKRGGMETALSAKINFVPEEFEKLFLRMKAFQVKIIQRLQKTGQTAFYIDYEDIQSLDAVNGLGKFLGAKTQLEAFSNTFKKQNPEPLADKVKNFDALEDTLRNIDHYDLGRLPNFEPRRGPMVPQYIAADNAKLLFLPIQCGPTEPVRNWLAEVNGTGTGSLSTGFTQKTLRQWKRKHHGHRTFTVLRHPVARLHTAFCRHFIGETPQTYHKIRQVLQKVYQVPLPEPGDSYDRRAHQAAFIKFAEFVKGNLTGQTALRVDGSWASLSQVVQGFGQFVLPDHILREDQLDLGLANLAEETGNEHQPVSQDAPDQPFSLADIYDQQVEDAVRAAYQKDYMLFGFSAWGKN
ncbi:MAG TPA: nodulation protein NodH [Aliiroseovarius sp.]|nr:nodulation protein NodH [Aliiroseovarius sp.]